MIYLIYTCYRNFNLTSSHENEKNRRRSWISVTLKRENFSTFLSQFLPHFNRNNRSGVRISFLLIFLFQFSYLHFSSDFSKSLLLRSRRHKLKIKTEKLAAIFPHKMCFSSSHTGPTLPTWQEKKVCRLSRVYASSRQLSTHADQLTSSSSTIFQTLRRFSRGFH